MTKYVHRTCTDQHRLVTQCHTLVWRAPGPRQTAKVSVAKMNSVRWGLRMHACMPGPGLPTAASQRLIRRSRVIIGRILYANVNAAI